MKIKFFVSSTFRDMDTERDILRTIITSRLNHMYEKKGLTFEFVDLRYNITTDQSLTMEEREQQIFDYCMEEIAHCTPYFIGLIGHRHGWIPQHKTNSQKVAIDEVWNDALKLNKDEMSVTALEFLHGAIGNINDNRPGKFIYVRSNDSYDHLSDNDLNDFFDSEALTAYNREMREYVKSLDGQKGIKTKEYTMSPISPSTEDITKWCDLLVGDISEMIDAKFANEVDLDPFYATNERYVADYVRNFRGRQELLDGIMHRVQNQIFISGEKGTGRTSLLCKAYDMERNSENVIALFASENATPQDFEGRTLAGKWAKQLSVKTGIQLPPELENYADYDHRAVCNAYNVFLQEVIEAKDCEVIHFVEGTSGDLNDLMTRDSNLVLLQHSYSDNMKYMSIDTTELDEESQEQIASQLRPNLKEKLLQHPSSSNIGWLSLAVHILENQMRSQQIEMRKGYEGLTGEEGITSYLCDLVSRFPIKIDELRSFWVILLSEIFGLEFVRDYMCGLKICAYGVTDEMMSHITGASLMWCISFRQTAGNGIIELNQMNLWSLKTRGTVLNVLKEKSDEHIKTLADLTKTYLKSLDEDSPECCNLFSCYLYLRDFNSLKNYFGKYKFYKNESVEAKRDYGWYTFASEQFFDIQSVITGILDVLPIDFVVWQDFISCQKIVPKNLCFVFMRLIEIKINEILVSDPNCELSKLLREVYRISVNTAPDPSAKKLELRKYLKFYSDLFNQDISWREEYLSAVNFHISFMPHDAHHEFLLFHLQELTRKSALQYEEGEATREFAKLFFSLTGTHLARYDYANGLQCALISSELFYNAIQSLLKDNISRRETVQALNCYQSVTMMLIFFYEKYNNTLNSDVILERIYGFVNTIDDLIGKFNGLGDHGDDGVADECRGIYLFSRCILIGADKTRSPEERLEALMQEHQICMNLSHTDCQPDADDMTMTDMGFMALMMLRPDAPLWMSLAHIFICYEAAYIIFKYNLKGEKCGEFSSFVVAIDSAVLFLIHKSVMPGGAPILVHILNYLKVMTGALFLANMESLSEEEIDSINGRISALLQGLEQLPPNSDIASELLSLSYNSTDNADIYEELLDNQGAMDIVELNKDRSDCGFFDSYYLGLAYLRVGMCKEAKNQFAVLMSRRRVLNENQEFSCLCNFLAACLKDLDFENFRNFYDNKLSDEEREDSDVIELYDLYDKFHKGLIDAEQLKESINGFMF